MRIQNIKMYDLLKQNIEYFKSIANELDKNFYKIVDFDKTLKELKTIFQKYKDDY